MYFRKQATPARPPTFEVPVFSPAAARAAVTRGVNRLEVNRAGSYHAGGLTPTLGEVGEAAADLVHAGAHNGAAAGTLPVRVMIRPRGPPDGEGEPDFVYSDDEFSEMRESVAAFASSGFLSPTRGDGFVFGVLKKEDSGKLVVDADRCRKLVQAADPFACVFHRAFDLVLDSGAGESDGAIDAALAALRDCGFAGVLTAGGTGREGAAAHTDTLRRLVAAERAVAGAAESRSHASIEIIVGGGVRSGNLAQLAQAILPSESTASASSSAEAAAHPSPVSFHSSCLNAAAAGQSGGTDGESVDEEEISKIRKILDEM